MADRGVPPHHLAYQPRTPAPHLSVSSLTDSDFYTLGGKLMSNAYWTGVTLSRLLAHVGVQPEAHAVVIRSADNYYKSFALEQVLGSGCLVAAHHEMARRCLTSTAFHCDSSCLVRAA